MAAKMQLQELASLSLIRLLTPSLTHPETEILPPGLLPFSPSEIYLDRKALTDIVKHPRLSLLIFPTVESTSAVQMFWVFFALNVVLHILSVFQPHLLSDVD